MGHFPLKAYQGGGIIAPIEAEKFKAFTVGVLRYYEENLSAYRGKCRAIQEAARQFDWKYTIDDWVALIESAGPRGDRSAVENMLESVRLEGMPTAVNEVDKTFLRIYHQNEFRGSESVSGPGSSVAKTAKLRTELPNLLESFGIKRMIDAPCGDMNWMRQLKYDFEFFLGVDVVPDLIELLRAQLWPEQFHFQVGDICQQVLPKADAIFCRDCLVHLPFSKIWHAIRLFKMSGAKYLLTTTFTDKENFDISIGDWRPLNFQAKPFCWPAPIGLSRRITRKILISGVRLNLLASGT